MQKGDLLLISTVYTILLIGIFIFLLRKKEENETYYPLKVIGYFILGSFAFKLNQIPLPLGFIVFFLFLRPTINAKSKRVSAIVGLGAFFLVHLILPSIVDEWEKRPITFEREINSVYTVDFMNENRFISQSLEINDLNMKLEDFEVEYRKDGSIVKLRYKLVGYVEGELTLYNISYHIGENMYSIRKTNVDEWLQYDRLIDTSHFFDQLSILNIEQVTNAKGDFNTYVVKSNGWRTNYGIKNRKKVVIDNGQFKVLKDDKLPVECYYISTFGMKKLSETKNTEENTTTVSYESSDVVDYLFDVREKE